MRALELLRRPQRRMQPEDRGCLCSRSVCYVSMTDCSVYQGSRYARTYSTKVSFAMWLC